MKKNLSLYDWCIQNNRQDLINSLKKTGEIEKAKTFTYGSKKELLWYCDDCKKLYDKLIKDNPNLPKFYIYECEIQKKTLGNNGYKNKCPICNSRKIISGANDFVTRCKLNKDKYGHLIEEWHPDNIVKPNEIALNYTKKVYWKCPKCGYGNNKEWYVEPNSRINNGNNCPNCSSELRKSHAEKAVYYYIKKVFSEAIENYRIPDTNQLELDIYIPNLSLGIEYDGSYWHNKKPEKDQAKYRICKDRNIKLLRLREKGCKDISDIATYCYYLKSHNNKDLNNAIQYTFECIKTISKNNFVIPKIDWEKDFAEIEELIELQVKEDSVAKYQLLNDQWHPDLNGRTTTDRVYAQSNTKRYWRCLECGYGTKGEWHVSPNSRIEDSKNNKINGCPACGGKKLYKGYNDFETRCNDKKYQKEYKKKYNKNLKLLLEEWNEVENSKIIAKNGKPLTKDNILFGSSDEVAWICSKCGYGKNGDYWKTPLKARTLNGRGCPACSGNIVAKGYNDIATTHPEIAKQWDDEKNLRENGRTKYNTSHGWKEKIWWICEKGHSYDASPNDRTNKGTGCRYCSNKDVLQGFNDLETFCNTEENKEANKHLLKEWQECNKLKPSEVVWSSNKIVKWKCSNPECGHEWETAVRHRVTYIQENGKLHKGTGCDKCARKQNALALRKGKELSTLNPELAKDWHPNPNKNFSEKYGIILTPDNTAANSHDIVLWKCHVCGYEWEKEVKYRNQHQKKCPICKYNNKVSCINFKDRKCEITKDLIVPYLSGKICHFTNFEAYKKIIEDGFIKPSIDERCRGYIRKWVCMADFRNIDTRKSSWEEIVKIASRNNIVFVLKESAHNNIEDPVDFSFRETNKEEGWYIPYFECWYKGILELDKIETIYYIDKDESIKNMSIAIDKYLRSS